MPKSGVSSDIVVGSRINHKIIEPVECIFTVACGGCSTVTVVEIYRSRAGTCRNAIDLDPKNGKIPIYLVFNPIIQLSGSIALGETDIPKICPAVIIKIDILPAIGTASLMNNKPNGIIRKQLHR